MLGPRARVKAYTLATQQTERENNDENESISIR